MKRRRIALPHPAGWTRPARALLLLAVALSCFASGLWLHAGERSAARLEALHRRAGLQQQLKGALAGNATLPDLQRQQGELAMRLSTAEDALWPEGGEAGALLQLKLARRAEECGLTMESSRPLGAAGRGAEISVRGQYTQLLRFVELVTAAPWPLLIEALEIVRAQREGEPTLLMNATLRIMPRTDNDKDGQT